MHECNRRSFMKGGALAAVALTAGLGGVPLLSLAA